MFRGIFVSAICFLRGIPLFFRATPRTPLRALGIVALDSLRVLRHSGPLSREKVDEIAALMDVHGYANAVIDHKDQREVERATSHRALEQAGLAPLVKQSLGALHEIERQRPPIGGDRQRFEEARAYREAVAALTLGAAATIALDLASLEDGIGTTRVDGDVQLLFRVLMQCQIIDDVLDYEEDLAAGLPGFLTAAASLPEAIEWTVQASRSYGASTTAATSAFPFRVVLWAITAVTATVLALRFAFTVHQLRHLERLKRA